ncbi:MAG: 4Fe-4S dicluster-binding protein [Candidatus Electrothrix gigas]
MFSLFLVYLIIKRALRAANKKEKAMYEIEVDKDKCTGCEECVGACPAGVFEIVDGKSSPVNDDECLGCETCVEVCEAQAITVTES